MHIIFSCKQASCPRSQCSAAGQRLSSAKSAIRSLVKVMMALSFGIQLFTRRSPHTNRRLTLFSSSSSNRTHTVREYDGAKNEIAYQIMCTHLRTCECVHLHPIGRMDGFGHDVTARSFVRSVLSHWWDQSAKRQAQLLRDLGVCCDFGYFVENILPYHHNFVDDVHAISNTLKLLCWLWKLATDDYFFSYIHHETIWKIIFNLYEQPHGRRRTSK